MQRQDPSNFLLFNNEEFQTIVAANNHLFTLRPGETQWHLLCKYNAVALMVVSIFVIECINNAEKLTPEIQQAVIKYIKEALNNVGNDSKVIDDFIKNEISFNLKKFVDTVITHVPGEKRQKISWYEHRNPEEGKPNTAKGTLNLGDRGEKVSPLELYDVINKFPWKHPSVAMEIDKIIEEIMKKFNTKQRFQEKFQGKYNLFVRKYEKTPDEVKKINASENVKIAKEINLTFHFKSAQMVLFKGASFSNPKVEYVLNQHIAVNNARPATHERHHETKNEKKGLTR